MPLPTTDTTLRHTDTYPDRVWISIGFQTSGVRRHSEFVRILRGHQFRGRDYQLRRTFSAPSLRHPVNVTAKFDRYRFMATFTLELNALRELRDLDAHYDERVRPYLDPDHRNIGETNWLHPDQVTDSIHETVVDRLWVMLLEVQRQLIDVSLSLIRSDHPIAQPLPVIRFELVEIAVDLASSDPHRCLRRIGPQFKCQFNRVIATRYGNSARGYVEVQADGNLLRGFNAAHDKYKA